MMERVLANWPVKLLSLVVAVLLWFYVLGSEDPQTTQAIDVPVVTVNEPTDLKTIEVTPKTVELRLRGRESALAQADVSRMRMEANLRKAKVGEQRVPVRVAGLPLSLTVLPGYPSTVTVEVDKIIERNRPVDYERRGDPAEGFVIEQISLEPTEVTVRGATSIVRNVIRAVVIVDTSGLNTSMDFEAELEARNSRDQTVGEVSFDPETVSVSVQVRQVSVKTVPVRPVVGSPPAGYRVVNVSADPIVVTVTGNEGLSSVRSVPTIPVDISGLRGTKTYAVPLNVPAELSVLGPASVSVTVRTMQPSSAASGEAGSSDASDDELDESVEPEEEIDVPGENEDSGPSSEAGDDAEDTPGTSQGGETTDQPAVEENDSATTPESTEDLGS